MSTPQYRNKTPRTIRLLAAIAAAVTIGLVVNASPASAGAYDSPAVRGGFVPTPASSATTLRTPITAAAASTSTFDSAGSWNGIAVPEPARYHRRAYTGQHGYNAEAVRRLCRGGGAYQDFVSVLYVQKKLPLPPYRLSYAWKLVAKQYRIVHLYYPMVGVVTQTGYVQTLTFTCLP